LMPRWILGKCCPDNIIGHSSLATEGTDNDSWLPMGTAHGPDLNVRTCFSTLPVSSERAFHNIKVRHLPFGRTEVVLPLGPLRTLALPLDHTYMSHAARCVCAPSTTK